MNGTNAQEFRIHLKEWMETARAEPVRITRKSGESFILVNENDFSNLQQEVVRLQGALLGMMDVVEGRTKEISQSSIKNSAANIKSLLLAKKDKKAVG
jgi:PHD/YefM family antitoxin component YafN of YafNO toxin-antitoxin module